MRKNPSLQEAAYLSLDYENTSGEFIGAGRENKPETKFY